MINFNIPIAKNEAQVQMSSGVSSSGDTIQLKTGEASLLPAGNMSTATSAGTATTLNSTGIGAKVAVGDFIRNITDGSIAWVLTVSADSITTTTLANGSANVWASSNEWVVGSFYAWLSKKDGSGNDSTRELVFVKYVDSATDQMHIETRGVEGAATTFAADDYISVYVSAQYFTQVGKAIGNLMERKAENSDTVHLTGAETISGSKTFSVPVSGTAPVTNLHLTTKLYVDAAIAAAIDVDAIVGDVLTALATDGATSILTEELKVVNKSLIITDPGTAPVASLPGTSGNIPAGTYTYKYYLTNASDAGRTDFTANSNSLVVTTPAKVEVSITNIPDNATKLYLYRNNAGGTVYGLVDTITLANTDDFVYTDNTETATIDENTLSGDDVIDLTAETEIWAGTNNFSGSSSGSDNLPTGVYEFYFAYKFGDKYFIESLFWQTTSQTGGDNKYFGVGGYSGIATDFPTSKTVGALTSTDRVVLCRKPDGDFIVDESPRIGVATTFYIFYRPDAGSVAFQAFQDNNDFTLYPTVAASQISGDDWTNPTFATQTLPGATTFQSTATISNSSATKDNTFTLPNGSGELALNLAAVNSSYTFRPPLTSLGSFSVGSQISDFRDMCWDGTYFWALTSNGVYRYLEDGTYDSFTFSTASQNSNMEGICWDGTHFVITSPNSNTTYKYNADGTYASISFSGSNEYGCDGICWDGEKYWGVKDTTNLVYEIAQDGTIGATSFSVGAQVGTPEGITWDGSHLCVVGGSTAGIARYTKTGTHVSTSASVGTSNRYGIEWTGSQFVIACDNGSSELAYKYVGFTGTITDNNSNGGLDKLKAGDMVAVAGTTNNNGVFYVNGVSTDTALVSTISTSETATDSYIKKI